MLHDTCYLNNKPENPVPDEPKPDALEVRRKFLAQCARGGRNGKHEDKVRAGKAGYAARLKKLQDQTKE